MTPPHSPHLTPTDVDAWLEGTLPLSASTHVGQCADCRALLVAEGRLIESLQRLPRLGPSIGFADRVMAQVTLQVPTRRRIPVVPVRWALAAGAVLSLGASLAWATANQAFLTDLSQWALAEGQAAAATLAADLAARLDAAPTWLALRDAFASPLRGAAVGTALAVLYGSGVLALRRLMALPATAGAVDAGR